MSIENGVLVSPNQVGLVEEDDHNIYVEMSIGDSKQTITLTLPKSEFEYKG